MKKDKYTCPVCRTNVSQLANIFDKLFCIACVCEMAEEVIRINKSLESDSKILQKGVDRTTKDCRKLMNENSLLKGIGVSTILEDEITLKLENTFLHERVRLLEERLARHEEV